VIDPEREYAVQAGVRTGTLALLALCLSACAIFGPPAGPASGSSAHLSSSPVVFLNGFERAVSRRDWPVAMLYLDPAYVAEQHDDFLNGRTEQFFVELLGLYRVCKGVVPPVCLEGVRGMRRVRTPGPAAETGVPVQFRIEMKDADRPVNSELHLKLGPSPRSFSLFGAVG
jgi:hypothetical protein